MLPSSAGRFLRERRLIGDSLSESVAPKMSANESLRISVWFLAWTIPGLLLLGVFVFLPFGAMVFPGLAALAALVLIYLHRPKGPELLGILLGVAMWGFAIAYFNRDSIPCPQSVSVTVTLKAGETSSCGGVAPIPFLIFGVVLASVSVLGAFIWIFVRRSRRQLREVAVIENPSE